MWRGQPWLVTGIAAVFLATTALVACPSGAAPAPEPLPPPPPVATTGRRRRVRRRRDDRALGVGDAVVRDHRHRRAADAVEPVRRALPEAAGTHRVRAAAPGHMPKERLVSFDDNVMIDLSLMPQPSSPPPSATRRRPSRGARAASRAPLRGARAPRARRRRRVPPAMRASRPGAARAGRGRTQVERHRAARRMGAAAQARHRHQQPIWGRKMKSLFAVLVTAAFAATLVAAPARRRGRRQRARGRQALSARRRSVQRR